MKTNKIGILFLVSVLALAGIGISYAGFTDTLAVYGTVNTATVTWNVADYSGTNVYKVWGAATAPTGEIYRWEGFVGHQTEAITYITTHYPGCQYELEASSWASAGTAPYDVNLAWNNIFPCQDFTVDIIIQYTGSIPAKINSANIMTINDPGNKLATLWTATQQSGAPAVTYGACFATWGGELGWIIHYDQPVTIGTQIHTGQYIYAFMTIHLPQDNYYQGLTGSTFGASVSIVQWNEYPYIMPS